MLGTEVEHLLRFRQPADQRAGNRAAPEDQLARSEIGVGVLRHAEQDQRGIALEQGRVGVEIVAGRHGVKDQVETAGVGGHLGGIARHDHLVRAEREGIVALGRRGGEGDCLRAQRPRQLHPHVAEAADADNAHLLARPGTPVLERGIGGDPRAEQRRHGRELGGGVADLQHVVLVDHDRLRVAPVGVPRGVGRGGIVSAGPPVLAIVLQPFAARGAMAAAVDQTAHTDDVTHREARDPGADCGDLADDLVARNAGIARAAPFVARGMQVGMAHPAIADRDRHVVRAGGAAFDGHRGQRLVGRGRAKGMDVHEDYLSAGGETGRAIPLRDYRIYGWKTT